MREPIVATPRLVLRALREDDLDRLVELDADPEVRRYVDQPRPPTREDVAERLPRLLARYGPGAEPSYWAAERSGTGAFVGWFHLRPLEGDLSTLDLGYRLRREAWGLGYATEGARALVRRAFDRLEAERVVAHALEENAASQRVMEKAGLRPCGRFLHRDALPAVQFELTRAEDAAAQRGSPEPNPEAAG